MNLIDAVVENVLGSMHIDAEKTDSSIATAVAQTCARKARRSPQPRDYDITKEIKADLPNRKTKLIIV